jgi:hypothetical protein
MCMSATRRRVLWAASNALHLSMGRVTRCAAPWSCATWRSRRARGRVPHVPSSSGATRASHLRALRTGMAVGEKHRPFAHLQAHLDGVSVVGEPEYQGRLCTATNYAPPWGLVAASLLDGHGRLPAGRRHHRPEAPAGYWRRHAAARRRARPCRRAAVRGHTRCPCGGQPAPLLRALCTHVSACHSTRRDAIVRSIIQWHRPQPQEELR